MMRIDAYRNLNAAKRDMAVYIWSLRLDGKVAGHHASIYLTDVDLRVQPGGLARVKRDSRRTVYAYLRAASYSVPSTDLTMTAPPAGYRPLTCNPYKEGVFVFADDRTPAPLHLSSVLLTPLGAFARV